MTLKKLLAIIVLMCGLLWVTSALAAFTRITTVSAQPVVKDTETGLMWQGCESGKGGNGCDGATSDAATMTWQEALYYCQDLDWGSYTDWHLPSRNQLQSIVDYSENNPAINPGAFLLTSSSTFWTSSSDAGYSGADAGSSHDAWYVNFTSGRVGVSYVDGGNAAHVRCVRAVTGP